MGRHVWVLNLDVEDQLARPGYTRPRAVEARIRTLAARLGALVGASVVVVSGEDADRARDAAGADDGRGEPLARHTSDDVDRTRGAAFIGRAWCPVPSALALLARAGARPPPGPTEAVLRRVLHRRFAIDQGLGWAETRWITAASALAPGRWRLKRAYGYAGRGQRTVDAHALSAADTAWIEAAIGLAGGLVAEPELDRVEAAPSLHGYLLPDGRCQLGAPTLQRLDGRGAWQGSTLTALDPNHHAALSDAAERAAQALHAAGYFGAFGVDALIGRWRSEPVFLPLGELNARYTMGWGIGLAGWRPPAELP